MSAIRVAQAPSRVVVFDEEERGEGPGGRVLAEKLIDGLQEPLRLLHRKGRVRAARIHGAQVAQVRLKIRHQQRRGGSFAGDIADHEAEAVAAEREVIVVIAADRPGLHAEAAVFQRADFGLRLRKKSRLHFSRGFQFQGGHVFGFESLGVLAALLLDLAHGCLVFEERKGVAVYAEEGCGFSCPVLRLRRLRKRNAFLAPFFVLALRILRQERNLGRASDEAVFFRTRFGSNKDENGGSVRRANGETGVAARQVSVKRQFKAELIQLKAEAPLLIADENGDGGEADVEILAVRMKAAPVRLVAVTMAMA